MNTIRWSIIGTGRFGRIHAQAIQSLSGVELAALCNRTPEKLQQAAADFGVERTTTDYRELLADGDIDVIDICTHWEQHEAVARDALAAGKHVLLEKPMAPTTEQCRGIVQAAADADGQFMVGHVCRFDPRCSLAYEAIQSGRIGRIVSMHARRNLPRDTKGLRLDKISALMGDGVHDADLMMWFMGRAPQRVYARSKTVHSPTYPDLGWALLEFDEDVTGVVETVWCLPVNTPFTIDARMEVVGTEGALYIDCANAGLAIHDASGPYQPDTAYWPEQHGRLVGALSSELGYFIDCIRRGEAPAVVTPEDALRAVAAMEAAEKSAERGEPVGFPEG